MHSRGTFRAIRFIPLLLAPLLMDCGMGSYEEKAIQQMLETFLTAVQNDDEDLAKTCMIDMEGFRSLNPDVAARVDAESFMETTYAELIHHYRDMKQFFPRKELELDGFTIGTPWYQYKGHQAFKDSYMTVEADGEKVRVLLRGLVKIDHQWRIVDLSGNSEF